MINSLAFSRIYALTIVLYIKCSVTINSFLMNSLIKQQSIRTKYSHNIKFNSYYRSYCLFIDTSNEMSNWPADALSVPYIGNWSYYYRKHGIISPNIFSQYSL